MLVKEIEVYRDSGGNYEILDVHENGEMYLNVWDEENHAHNYIDITNLLKILKENNLV